MIMIFSVYHNIIYNLITAVQETMHNGITTNVQYYIIKDLNLVGCAFPCYRPLVILINLVNLVLHISVVK